MTTLLNLELIHDDNDFYRFIQVRKTKYYQAVNLEK